MAGNLQRTFSFENNDETSLRGGHPGGYRDDEPSASPPTYMYTDSPVRQSQQQMPPPPLPPQHRSEVTSSYELPALNTRNQDTQDLGHTMSNRTASTTTPGADNFGESAAGGGIAGVALGVSSTNVRERGMEAMRSVESFDHARAGIPAERAYNTVGSDTPYIPAAPTYNRMSQTGMDPFASPSPSRLSNPFEDTGGRSLAPLRGSPTLGGHISRESIPMNGYQPREGYAQSRASSYLDNPYNRFSTAWDPMVARGDIDPDAIDDEGDEGMMPPATQTRSAAGSQGGSQRNVPPAAAAAGGGFLAGLFGRKNATGGSRDASGQYGPVGGPMADTTAAAEKSEWLNQQTSGRKRLRWIVGIIIALIVVGAIVGGVVGALRSRSKSTQDVSSPGSGSSGGGSAQGEHGSSGDLDKNSAQIKKLMNNPDLHRVFPGIDYTPFNGQYPGCLTWPPSQSNITMDVAVLSQLTNTIRLYGTDCNQTEMVLHAIDKLGLTDMKVWLGVWLDNNQTTSNRGLSAMYDILSKNGADPFAGVIVGNEVLFRKDMTEDQLTQTLTDVKKNLTGQNINLPIATSDLGDDWTATLAESVDVVMSNIHPFFAGVTVDNASGWTWDFWQNHDTNLTTSTTKKNVISEVGWPSGGGTDCGTDATTTCTQGSVAGIDEMNTFMENFVCQSLANGTNFFWYIHTFHSLCTSPFVLFHLTNVMLNRFEAFDEPWKVQFNTPGKEWEDKWGLMDPGRNIKPGLKIPDCGGKDISS